MELSEARYLAERIIYKLAPVTERAMICGSIRRQRPDPHDVDIVCIPKRRPIKDLFGNIARWMPTVEFCDVIDSWEKLKGDAVGKYTQRLVEGMKVEISMCEEDNWGNLTLIRTGNSDFSQIIMTRALKCGLQQRDGYLWNDTKKIPLHSEEEYFKILDLPYVAPALRDKDAFRNLQCSRV